MAFLKATKHTRLFHDGHALYNGVLLEDGKYIHEYIPEGAAFDLTITEGETLHIEDKFLGHPYVQSAIRSKWVEVIEAPKPNQQSSSNSAAQAQESE